MNSEAGWWLVSMTRKDTIWNICVRCREHHESGDDCFQAELRRCEDYLKERGLWLSAGKFAFEVPSVHWCWKMLRLVNAHLTTWFSHFWRVASWDSGIIPWHQDTRSSSFLSITVSLWVEFHSMVWGYAKRHQSNIYRQWPQDSCQQRWTTCQFLSSGGCHVWIRPRTSTISAGLHREDIFQPRTNFSAVGDCREELNVECKQK